MLRLGKVNNILFIGKAMIRKTSSLENSLYRAGENGTTCVNVTGNLGRDLVKQPNVRHKFTTLFATLR